MPAVKPIKRPLNPVPFRDIIVTPALHIAGFMRRNVILTIAVAAAVLTMTVVPPDSEYIKYFDIKTLSCLFCVLAMVCALRNIDFFTVLARRVVSRFKTTRSCFLALCYITFIGSMFIANDMALITFLPLGSIILINTGKEKYMAFLFIMQNISANLGGMLTPFGNPQNLFLYSAFNIPASEFIFIMALPFTVAVLMITICCLCIKNEELIITDNQCKKMSCSRLIIYLVLFMLSIAIVFRGIPYWLGLVVIPAALLAADRKALHAVDYPLLFTFAAFFVFSGNMSRIPAVSGFFSEMLQKSTLLFSILSCQIISNVPSAILLSHFTDNYRELLLGVNIGGTGTLIASLASLITFREYGKHNNSKSLRYIFSFSIYNILFLAVLTVVSYLSVKFIKI